MRLLTIYLLLLVSVALSITPLRRRAREFPTQGLHVLLTHDCPRDMDDDWEITMIDVKGNGHYGRNDVAISHDLLREQTKRTMEFRYDRVVWVTGSGDATQGDVVQLESELAADSPRLVIADITETQLMPLAAARRERRWKDVPFPFCFSDARSALDR